MVSMAKWYERVNETWPEELPELSDEEAIRAAKKLFRFVHGRAIKCPVVIATGNVYTGWGLTRQGVRVLKVNPRRSRHGQLVSDYGWEDVVHGLSHAFGKGHSKEHARFELRLRKEVERRGWLAGGLKAAPKPASPAPSKDAARAERLAGIEARLKRWEAKLKRAQTALRKLSRSRSAMLRARPAANQSQIQLAA